MEAVHTNMVDLPIFTIQIHQKKGVFFIIWANHPIIPKFMVYDICIIFTYIWLIFMVNVHVGNNMTYIKCLGKGPLLANSLSSFAVHQVRQKNDLLEMSVK